MDIYCELFFDRIRVKISDEEIAFQTNPTFYQGKMNKTSLLSKRINGYMMYHKSGLSFLERFRYRFSGNTVYMLLNQEVQEASSVRQIKDFAERCLDGRTVIIIPKPVTFDSAELENIKKLRTEYITAPNQSESALAQVRAAMGSGNSLAGGTQ